MARGRRDQNNRTPVSLACTVCGGRNYKTSKSKSTQGQISLKKFCATCNAHTLHIDAK